MISTRPIENFNKKYDVVSLFLIFEGKILLLKRQTGKSQEERWGPPAGKVDEGEALETAICRESFEETGVKIEKEQIEKSEKHYWVRHGEIDFMFHVYSVEFSEKPKIVIREIEHCEHGWFSPQEALDLDLVEDEEAVVCDFFEIK